MVKLIVLAAQVSISKASEPGEEGQEEEEEEEEEVNNEEFAFRKMIFICTVVVVVFTILFERMWKVGARWMAGGPTKPSSSKTRSLPAESEQEGESEEPMGEVTPKRS